MPTGAGDATALAAALALLCLIRVGRAWNQSGVKHAGAADVVRQRAALAVSSCMVGLHAARCGGAGVPWVLRGGCCMVPLHGA
jgi:hypothetical protein